MQMTEGFATTVASVASAILIAATLEAAAYSKAIQGWSRSLSDEFMRRSTELSTTASAERQAALRSIAQETFPRFGVGALKTTVLLLLGQLWGVLLLAQTAAIVISLRWLADPTAPDNSQQAKLLLVAVGSGAVVVAVVPIFRIVFSPYGPLAEAWLESKLMQAALEASQAGGGEDEADSEPQQLLGRRAGEVGPGAPS
ncbi:hypothetical protein [Streptomyces sp. NPDC058985]|uniref:hypothetical protein n=1 Tax=Streptomyces sp. NPDC058985 TaxID=3346684 RepID=UPI0036CADC18